MITRVLPPPGSHAAWEGVYAQTAGQYADVPDPTVAHTMAGNGWIYVGPAGNTAARPAIPARQPGALGSEKNGAGTRFLDTTIAKLIWWDGSAWRDCTGAAV